MKIDSNNPNDLFVYDETSPSCLRWDVIRKGVVKGEVAGSLHKKHGAWAVQFRGAPKLVHRVIWEMFYGEFVGTVLHKNGDKSDNRLENLYLAQGRDNFLKKDDFSGESLRSIFDYSEGMLYWKEDRYSGLYGSVKNASRGDPIHCSYDKDGYASFRVIGSNKRLHRAIYEWHYGEIPEGLQIDHYDRDVTNNCIENLRLADRNLNGRNVSISSRNKTGTLGVRYRERGNNAYYIAMWREDGRQRDKAFAVNKYGDKRAKELAIQYRENTIARLNELGYGYTPHHGKY